MNMITVFDELADLAFIEIMSYLSSADALRAFTYLNDRYTRLLAERGYFHQVNLSITYAEQFHQLLEILPLDMIKTLIIDRTASPLQLLSWPYLPRLSKLYLRGVRDHDSILIFILLHAATLTHVTIQSDEYALTDGFSAKLYHTTYALRPLVQNILLRYLPHLRTLDLGFDSSHFIRDWDMTLHSPPLTYLRVTVFCVEDLLAIMATPPLSKTLRHLHVKLFDRWRNLISQVSELHIGFCMSSLRTFTLVKGLHQQFCDEWTLIEALTSATVTPVLQRAKLIVALDRADLNHIGRSALFNDHRLVDVQYAFAINDARSHSDLDQRIPRGSRSHPRSVVSATFVEGALIDDRPDAMPGKIFWRNVVGRAHLWYTLPWSFSEFGQLAIPDKKISQLEVLQPSRSSTTVTSSRLVRMDSVCNEVSSLLLRSPIAFPPNIKELNLCCCDRNIDLKLPSLYHLTVINSLDALRRCASISMNIQSITVVLDQMHIRFATGDWTALRFLRALPRLRSLRVVLYTLYMSADDPSCQIIAETTLWLVNFAFSYRRRGYFCGLDVESAFERCCSFIQQLRERIFALSADEKPECSVEDDGCGLMVWRAKPCHVPIYSV